MALSAGEFYSGGQVCDTRSRTVVLSETTNAVLGAGEFYSGGFLRDPDGRMVICQDAVHSALSAGEQYTAGDVRDTVGRVVCAAETVNTAISAGSQFSGGFLRDSRGRRIIALDTLGAALSAGEQYSAGQVFDSAGRLVLASEGGGAAPTLLTHTSGAALTSSPIDTTGATLLVVAVSFGLAQTVTDSKANTWTPLTAAGASPGSQLFVVTSPTSVGAGHTATISSSSGAPSFAFLAFKGTHGTLVDGQNGANAAATTLAPGSITTTGNNDVIVTALAADQAEAPSINLGFTIVESFGFVGGINYGVYVAWLAQPTAGPINPTWTVGTLANLASPIAAFH